MATESSSRVWSNLAVPPGASLLEELEARELAPEAIAAELGLTRRHFAQVIAGNKPVTAELALALEALLDIDASFWMNLQSDYSLTIARLKRDQK